MLKNNSIFYDDMLKALESPCIDWNKLKNKNIFITGATGLIGYSVVSLLILANIKKNINVNIYILVRDKNKALEMYGNQMQKIGSLHFIVGTVEEFDSQLNCIDYIIHGASMTKSSFFISNPVETINITVNGTMKMLEFAKNNPIESFVFLSSMEIYGKHNTDDPILEDTPTCISSNSIRNCYPIAKLMAENLCISSYFEYNVPIKIARLSQTFGAGVPVSDNRVFAQFAHSIIDNTDIILQTKGDSKRTYVYTMDAVIAILTMLLSGKNGEIYNISNENTFMSIYEMAQLASSLSNNVSVKIEDNKDNQTKYPPYHSYFLKSEKLNELGWKPTVNMKQMFERMIKSMKNSENV